MKLYYYFEDIVCEKQVDVDRFIDVSMNVDYCYEVKPTEEDFVEFAGTDYDEEEVLESDEFYDFMKEKYRNDAYMECKGN